MVPFSHHETNPGIAPQDCQLVQDGFELGGTVESCTRGIWIWDTPIKHKNKHGEFNLILMDTEGLGSTDRDTELDNKIFV